MRCSEARKRWTVFAQDTRANEVASGSSGGRGAAIGHDGGEADSLVEKKRSIAIIS
jgi:hypothetical protein